MRADPKPSPRRVASRVEWTELLDALPPYCQLCGSVGYDSNFTWVGLSTHHLISRAQGGDDVLENLVRLCGHGTAGCHSDVEHRRRRARERLREKLTPDQLRYCIDKVGRHRFATLYGRTCGACGQTIINAGAHAESCRGPERSFPAEAPPDHPGASS